MLLTPDKVTLRLRVKYICQCYYNYVQFVSRDIVYVRLSSQFRTAADSKKGRSSRKKTAKRTSEKPKRDKKRKRQREEKATESFDEKEESSSDTSEEVATTRKRNKENDH